MPAPLVSDALWSLIAPLLPVGPAKLKGGRPPHRQPSYPDRHTVTMAPRQKPSPSAQDMFVSHAANRVGVKITPRIRMSFGPAQKDATPGLLG